MNKVGPVALAAMLSMGTVFLVDLVRDFSSTTMRRAWPWVIAYLLVNSLASGLALLGLLELKIEIMPNVAANNWVKAVFSGIFLPSLLKSRLFNGKWVKARINLTPNIDTSK